MTPETRAFLAGVRDAEDPSPDDQRRVFSAIQAAAAVGAASGALSAASGSAKLGRVFGLAAAPAPKLAALALWVAAAAGDAGSAETRPVPARSPAPMAVIEPPFAELPKAPPTATPYPVPPSPRNSEASPAPAPTRTRAAARSDLRAELALLADVQRELKRGNGAAALALLRTPARDPQLFAERGAAEILALCAAGRAAEARRKAAEFSRRFPKSVHASAIARSCAGPGSELGDPKEK